MRGNNQSEISSLGSTPPNDTAFNGICLQYIAIAFDINIEKLETNKLPLSAIAAKNSTLIKIFRSVSISPFIQEIQNDIKILSKIKNYEEVVYLNSSDAFNSPLVRRKIRNSVKNSKFSPVIVSYTEIINFLHEKSGFRDYKLFVHADLEYLYRTAIYNHDRSYLILDEILNYIHSENHGPPAQETKDLSLSRLNNKITANFGPPEQEKIRQYYFGIWGKKEIVEQYINQNFYSKSEDLFSLRLKIQKEFIKRNKFKEVKTPVNYIGTLMDIAESLLPPGKENCPYFLSLCEAIVMYFFEYCDFGQRFENEEPSLLQKKSLDYNDTSE